LLNTKRAIFQLYHEQVAFRCADIDVRFVLIQQCLYSASSPKQHSVGRHIVLLGQRH